MWLVQGLPAPRDAVPMKTAGFGAGRVGLPGAGLRVRPARCAARQSKVRAADAWPSRLPTTAALWGFKRRAADDGG